jgi:hypothetical protein
MVEHDPVLVHCTAEIVQLTLDPDEDLIQVPLVSWLGPPPTTQAAGETFGRTSGTTPRSASSNSDIP